MTVHLVSSDLMIQSKIAAAAAAGGLEYAVVGSADQLPELGEGVLVIDLESRAADAALRQVRDRLVSSAVTTTLAFGPHVQEAKLQAAKDAGCEQVFTRGQFLNHATEILARYAAR